MKSLRFIDLFCGLGGFRIALEQKGWKCVFSSDINKYTKEVYKLNFNEYPHDDITKIHENYIPEHDILCGGFPCQTFSISGLKNGLNDKKGQLIHEIIRIAKHKKPKILLLEDVKGLKILENGKNLKYILNLIEESGYVPNYYLLNSKDYNALSVITQYRTKVRQVVKVPRNVFNPKPNVDSSVLQFEFKEKDPTVNEELFFSMVKACFKQRRKTILNNFGEWLNDKEKARIYLEDAGIDVARRAESCTCEEFLKLYRRIEHENICVCKD